MESCQVPFQTFMSSTVTEERCSSERSNSVSELSPQSMQVVGVPHGFIGSLDVFIHQARDIQNICIYHKQDVYAKLCLTSDPESAISTKIINGGGRNPVFNESIRLSVRSIDSSLKCELWMLSRVKNYLGDQLLGFSLLPLSEVVMGNGKLAQEFTLSSTDLFHSPAGFVQLSVSYIGSSPEVMAIAAPAASAMEDAELPHSVTDDSIPCEYVKIEFPDLKVVNENKMMVSEYFGIPCTNLDSQNGESMVSAGGDDYPDNDAGVRIVESFSADNSLDSPECLRNDTPLSSFSADVSSAVAPATSQAISELSGATGSPTQKTKDTEIADGDTGSSSCTIEKAYVPPLIKIDIEPAHPVVQQEIVDMYMKSMQQFTESLAKMKLPMDSENSSSGGGDSMEKGNGTSEKKLQVSKNKGAKVFYGSRAFF